MGKQTAQADLQRNKMRIFRHRLTLEKISSLTEGNLRLFFPVEIESIAQPNKAGRNSLVFIESEKYLPLVRRSSPGLIVTNSDLVEKLYECGTNLLVVDNPYHAVLKLVLYWLELEKGQFETFIHPTAVIHSGVELHEKVIIGAYTVVQEGVRIGEYCQIGAHCIIGKQAILGKNCLIYPNITIYNDTEIGDDVIIHSGSVIGADGFGYILLESVQQKIPQIGNVIIGNNVEIGANTTIDRATIGSTIIGEGTKIDNLVQIGHNCIIGKHCILCAQVGLAGSTTLGDYVYLAGQVGLAGHLTVGDRAKVGAKSGVSSDLAADGQYFGIPAVDANRMKRIIAVQHSLPELRRFVVKLKKKSEQEQS